MNVERKDSILERAEQFATQILAPLKTRDGISFMLNVHDLETGYQRRNVVILPWLKRLWREVVRLVDSSEDIQQRVCIVGAAGIGKTTTTAWLIRYLLRLEGSTVVYHIKSATGGWIYKFGRERVQAYPSSNFEDLACLSDPNTYYVVDPGNSGSNCDPGPLFEAKTIIISCPNSNHWGGNEFTKLRNRTVGRFLYMPTWELDELIAVKPLISNSKKLDESIIIARFDIFGGIPRHVLAPVSPSGTAALRQIWMLQQHAIHALTPRQVKQIVQTESPVSLSLLDATTYVQSNCLGLVVGRKPDGAYNFGLGIPVLGSKSVEREVAYLHLSTLCRTSLSKSGRHRVLEAHCQMLLSSGRRSLMAKHWAEGQFCRGYYYKWDKHFLGAAMQAQCVPYIVESAIENSNTMYCNLVPTEEPFVGDFCYRDDYDVLHVFQVAQDDMRIADPIAIESIAQQAEEAKLEMILYFMVPEDKFKRFETSPANPICSCDIYHVRIPAF